jgi:hypothetical protein
MLAAAAAVLLVAAPLLFTDSGFGLDFTNHLWLSWAEGTGLAQAGHPSYFLNTRELGVFYPLFAFYGGSLYTIVGVVSDLLGGQPVVAYAGVITVAIAGSYGGMVWLGRQLGLRGWTLHAPALAVVTSAYYITNLYGRGAWTEFMAVAVIAPLLASGLCLIRAPAWQAWPTLIFVVSTIVFTGSHNITLLWATTIFVLAAVIMWAAQGAPRRLPGRRFAMLGGLGLASALVNAWYLVPDLSYAGDVEARLEIPAGGATATFFDTPQTLFNPLRAIPAASTTPALYVQIPMWFLAWGLLAGAVLLWRRGAGGRLRRAWLGLVVLIAIVLAMIMLTSLWRSVPFPYDEIQFPYRLGSYVFYAVGGLVLVSALATQRAAGSSAPRRTVVALRVALACACAVSIGLCIWQQWVPNTLFANLSYSHRQEALASVNEPPRTWYDGGSYSDIQAPVVAVAPGRVLAIPPSSVHGDRFSAWLAAPPGPEPIQTNIDGGGYLVRISGLKRVGRNEDGWAVVKREGDGSGPVHVTIEINHSATIVLGWALSLLGCAAVIATLAWTVVRARRCRRAPPPGTQAQAG